LHLK